MSGSRMHLPRRLAASPEEGQAFVAAMSGVDAPRVASFMELMDFAAVWVAQMADWLDAHGLSVGRFVVLLSLTALGKDEMAPSEIADRMDVTRATVTGLVDGLEVDGFVERVPSSEDRRKVMVRLTPSGVDLANQLVPQHFERVSHVMTALSQTDIRKLRNMASKLKTGTEDLPHG